jgi:hypothetical protein
MAKKNKGLNMSKVKEIRNEVEEVMEVTPVVVQEMAEHVGASLEDIDALREMIVEEQLKEMEEERVKEEKEIDNMKNKVNNGIKYAILQGKGVETMEKYVSGKQILAIFKSYKEIVGLEMDDKQKTYIKTLNPKQISNILHTLNIARKSLAV